MRGDEVQRTGFVLVSRQTGVKAVDSCLRELKEGYPGCFSLIIQIGRREAPDLGKAFFKTAVFTREKQKQEFADSLQEKEEGVKTADLDYVFVILDVGMYRRELLNRFMKKVLRNYREILKDLVN